jgi:hypothetical protein
MKEIKMTNGKPTIYNTLHGKPTIYNTLHGKLKIYNTLHGKLKINQHESHEIPGVNSGAKMKLK